MSLDMLQCCGVFEFYYGDGEDIEDPAECLKDSIKMSELWYVGWNDSNGYMNRQPPFILFSDRVNRRSIVKIIELIKKEKLGKILSPHARLNDNSNRVIKVWIWSPDYRRLRSWMKPPKRAKKSKASRKPQERLPGGGW